MDDRGETRGREREKWHLRKGGVREEGERQTKYLV
jgi:hypothetical protein